MEVKEVDRLARDRGFANLDIFDLAVIIGEEQLAHRDLVNHTILLSPDDVSVGVVKAAPVHRSEDTRNLAPLYQDGLFQHVCRIGDAHGVIGACEGNESGGRGEVLLTIGIDKVKCESVNALYRNLIVRRRDSGEHLRVEVPIALLLQGENIADTILRLLLSIHVGDFRRNTLNLPTAIL